MAGRQQWRGHRRHQSGERDKLGSVPKMGADETRAAIDAPTALCPPGARSPPKNAPPFAQLVQFDDGASGRFSAPDDPEQGKPLAEAKGEISYAASFMSGLLKKANVFMATPFPVIRR